MMLYAYLWLAAESNGAFMHIQTKEIVLANKLCMLDQFVVVIPPSYASQWIGEPYLFASAFPLITGSSSEALMLSYRYSLPLFNGSDIVVPNFDKNKVDVISVIVYFGKNRKMKLEYFISDHLIAIKSPYVEYTNGIRILKINGVLYSVSVFPSNSFVYLNPYISRVKLMNFAIGVIIAIKS